MGVKCRWKHGCRANHAFTGGDLCVPQLSIDQMDVKCRWHVVLNGAQELQELATAMPAMQLAHDLARGRIQCGKQGGRAMVDIIMTAPLGHAERQRQQRLRTIERLNLGIIAAVLRARLASVLICDEGTPSAALKLSA